MRSLPFLLAFGCVSDSVPVDGSVDSGPQPDVAGVDASDVVVPADVDAGPQMCPLDKAFDLPTPLTLNKPTSNESSISLTDDELDAVYTSDEGGNADLLGSTRPSTLVDFPFGSKTLLGKVNTTATESEPSLSADGKTLAFTRLIGSIRRIFVATRPTRVDAFGDPVQLSAVANPVSVDSLSPFLTRDGKSLYFGAAVGSNYDIYQTEWPVPVTRTLVYGSANVDVGPVLDQTELMMFFASYPTAPQTADVYKVTRSKVGQAWSAPQKQTELSSSVHDEPNWLSSDNCRLYLTRALASPPGYEILLAVRRPN